MTTTPDSPTAGPQGPAGGAPAHGTGPQTFTAPPPPPAAPEPPAPGTQGPTFWDQIHRLGVTRDRSNGWFGGVCAGIANRLGVDPLLIRALAIILAIAGGFGFVAYVLAWLLLPDTNGRILLREVGRGDVTGIVLVVVLAILLMSGLSFGDGTWLGGWFVPIAALAIIFLLFNRKQDGRQPVPPTGHVHDASAPAPAYGPPPGPVGQQSYAAPATYPAQPTFPGAPVGQSAPVPPVPPVPPTAHSYGPPRPQRRGAPKGSGAIVLGLAVIGYGLGHLIDAPTGFNGSGHFLGLLIALGVTSIGALVLGLSGRRGGMASVLTVLLLGPVTVSGLIEREPFGPGEGQVVTWAPTTSGGYNLGAGEATLDLSQVQPASATTPDATVPTPPPVPSSPAAPAPTADPALPGTVDTLPGVVTISASVGLGQLVVLVPDNVILNVQSSVGVGDLDLGPFDTERSGPTGGIGTTQQRTFSTGSSETKTEIDLRVQVGFGDLTFQEK